MREGGVSPERSESHCVKLAERGGYTRHFNHFPFLGGGILKLYNSTMPHLLHMLVYPCRIYLLDFTTVIYFMHELVLAQQT